MVKQIGMHKASQLATVKQFNGVMQTV